MTKIVREKDAKRCVDSAITYGHFSTIHPGHIRYLKYAKTLAERLIICLIGDNNEEDYPFKQIDRAEALALLRIADEIILLESKNLKDIIDRVSPSMLILGKELEKKDELIGAIKRQKDRGGKVQFHAGEIHYANSDLLNNSERVLKMRRINGFKEACKKQNLDLGQIITSIDQWEKVNLVVIGDTIVDQYAACEALGMSAEAPVVVVRELKEKTFMGGAAIVAAHIRALGAKCHLISVIGKDDAGSFMRRALKEKNIQDEIIEDESRPTTFKKRYVVENQKLFRVSKLEEHSLSGEVEDEVINRLERIAPTVDGIVVSDFVYGVVTKKILKTISKLANQHGLFIFGDVQCSSQVGSITQFHGYSLLCPNEREARLAMQDKNMGLEKLSQSLIETTESKRMIMKLGSEGFIAYDHGENGKISSQAFPALSVNPVDVAGAGDSLLGLMAVGLCAGNSLMECSGLACCMTAIAVERMGNTPITVDELKVRALELH